MTELTPEIALIMMWAAWWISWIAAAAWSDRAVNAPAARYRVMYRLLPAVGEAWLGAGMMTSGWYFKARLEERFLREELGAEAYDAYARRVPMLVPFVTSH